jgi:hypothetical protein
VRVLGLVVHHPGGPNLAPLLPSTLDIHYHLSRSAEKLQLPSPPPFPLDPPAENTRQPEFEVPRF